MGSGDWFRTIISLKKVKEDRSKQAKVHSATDKSNGSKWRYRPRKESNSHVNGASSRNPAGLVVPIEDIAATRIQTAFRAFRRKSTTEKSNGSKWRYRTRKGSSSLLNGASGRNAGALGISIEDIAATRIQTAFRAFMARKKLRCLKGTVRFQVLIQGQTIGKQASTALSYIHSWSRIQTQIKARRLCMVTEGRLRQKKLENQLKLEAKLQELEEEWCGGSETMEEILSRIQQREEAAVKRERAMAYAFSHQWRANSSQTLGQTYYDLGKENWGWSWMERWIAARPWEIRTPSQSFHPKKVQARQVSKLGNITNHPATKIPVSIKLAMTNGKETTKARKLSYPTAEKQVVQEAKTKVGSSSQSETEEANAK
ncbi:hypothetical protein L1049_001534 [Liquidambar formosana]|uniref:Protein IQ-DOMAIN 1 n=1 Tax=Liquidambar formosana TaxID=63359 RepID=A0AAP0NCK9_LIQFO